MKSWITGSMKVEMSRFMSTYSRIRVELMSSRWGGSWSWITFPVMPSSFPSGRGGWPALRKMMWSMEWTDQSTGAA